jgi:hypothetical protein
VLPDEPEDLREVVQYCARQNAGEHHAPQPVSAM